MSIGLLACLVSVQCGKHVAVQEQRIQICLLKRVVLLVMVQVSLLAASANFKVVAVMDMQQAACCALLHTVTGCMQATQ